MLTKSDVIYLSGPMTVYADTGYNVHRFKAVEKMIGQKVGCKVLNPTTSFGGKTDRKKSEYMREDFRMLLEATAVVLLDDWHLGQGGVQAEIVVAWNIGLPFYDERLDPIRLEPVIEIKSIPVDKQG